MLADRITWQVAIAGLGWVAETIHLPYLSSSPVVNLVGGLDSDERRSQLMFERFGLVPFQSVDHLLASPADIVVICTPPSSHAALIIRALRHGKHVICEKPLATSITDARAIAGVSRATRRHVFCCMSNRYRQDVQRMALEVREGRIGEPRFMRASWLRARGIPASEGALEKGVLWDLGTHLIDLAVWVTGWRDPVSVTANQTQIALGQPLETASWYRHSPSVSANSPMIDTVIVDIVFRNGAIGSIEASWAAHIPDDRTEILLLGTEAALRLYTVFGWSSSRDLVPGPALSISSRHDTGWIELLREQDREHSEYRTQLDHFFESLRRGSGEAEELEVVLEGITILGAAESDLKQLEART